MPTDDATQNIGDEVVGNTDGEAGAYGAGPVEITETEPEVFIRKSRNSKYIIEYRRGMCIGAASCAAIAPATFQMDDENRAELISPGSEPEDDDEVILAAAQSCPVFAIIIKDAATGEQIFPPLE